MNLYLPLRSPLSSAHRNRNGRRHHHRTRHATAEAGHKGYGDEDGFRFFLLDAAPGSSAAVTEVLERSLTDFGFDVVETRRRLAHFHRVENTYLATFQFLGGLGLVLGTLGLAAVMLRNILERRHELALLRALGYHSGHFAWIVVRENTLLLFGGLVTRAICAAIAIAPALATRGGSLSLPFSLLIPVLASGLVASVLAVRATVAPRCWRLCEPSSGEAAPSAASQDSCQPGASHLYRILPSKTPISRFSPSANCLSSMRSLV